MLNAGVNALFCVIKSRVFRYTFASKVVCGDTKYSSNTGTCGKHYMMCLFQWDITRTLRSDDGDGNDNVKKETDLSKTTILQVHKCFLYISLPSLHDYDVIMPNFAFYGGRIQGTAKFSFWTWTWFLRIQLQEGSSTFDEAIRVGIITIKIFNFWATFLLPSPSSDLKGPVQLTCHHFASSMLTTCRMSPVEKAIPTSLQGISGSCRGL